ncbi:MAG: Isoquinoline 1-oxidoreductase subunit beta [Syntrophus sp. SKADARSKE-3]|nr:Isoquinoline 1-oxidoreductase subunit beta [Syntrophus sp. SKADARSKE-3]
MNTIINVNQGGSETGKGNGLSLEFGVPCGAGAGAQPDADRGQTFILNPFIRIGVDGIVTVIANKSEMGQGVYTSLSMLLAEELECDWSKVRVEPAPVDSVYNNPVTGVQMTGGSLSIRTEWERLRNLGAAAREMLIGAAAEIWKVDKTECRAENSTVIHRSGKKLTFGELAGKAASMPVPENIPLKDPSHFHTIGKAILRLDNMIKVTGKAIFGMDVTIPGMLTALVARPPVFGGKLKSFDENGAKAVPGVKTVIAAAGGVVVAADTFWAAKKGRDALSIVWDEGSFADISTEGIHDEYRRLAESPGAPARKDGNPGQALTDAAKRLDAEYELPYLAHACMEPLNCVVDLRADGCDIWTGTQAQTLHRRDAARVLGLDPEQVNLHTVYLGGGFGRRGNPHSDFVVEAVEVAKALKRPVKVIWTREDDTKGGYYRPLCHSRLSGGLDEHGKQVAWCHTIVGQSIMKGTIYAPMRIKNGIDTSSTEGATTIPYEIPNLFVGLHSPDIAVPVQWWRSVGYSHTCFAVESFIDEMAFAAGKDPYEFRRELLTDHPRHRGVLDLAANKAGWGTPLPAGRSRGIAMCESYGSFIAEIAEVSVEPSGDIRVHRVVCAVDCGNIVNPSSIEAQMESGIVYGLTAVLYGEITVQNGRVVQGNFNNYPLLRIGRMPAVEVHIVPSMENPGGIGEPGTPPIAPAVTNAIFAATGKRIRRLPIAAGR